MTTDQIEKKILLRAPVGRVWKALANSAEFGHWFGMTFEDEFAPGRVMHGTLTPTKVDDEVAERQAPYEGKVFEITIERMEPERLLSFRWHPFALEPDYDYSAEATTLIEFVLVEQAEGVLLTVTESGFDRIPLARRVKAFTANEGGWTMVITLIEKYVCA